MSLLLISVVTKILRDQRVPIIWFVANCGGILGLCMGFSIVTVFEVFHCIFKFFLSKLFFCKSCDSATSLCCPGFDSRLRQQNGTNNSEHITVNGSYSLTPCVRNENEAGESNEDEISSGRSLLHPSQKQHYNKTNL